MSSKLSGLYRRAPDTVYAGPGKEPPIVHNDVPWFSVIIWPIVGVFFLALCAWVCFDCYKRRGKAKEEATQAIIDHTGPAGTELHMRNPRPLYA
jgi:hypothetical protein